ncbi:hypothetical protein D477_000560 [Arthrobacter crystallopoietes BAB-32]|uniref:Uncharacterized protein n=1 Tax=Arthrobacter crystallopoietes BAB-32 TaxID=1246476 RepID=N1VCY2_9MICC|nr:hypothetical protein D477_000560 [Arthrobacter crystallopoietes BAB-32]
MSLAAPAHHVTDTQTYFLDPTDPFPKGLLP